MQISLDLECVSYLSIANSIQVKSRNLLKEMCSGLLCHWMRSILFDFGVNNKSVSETLDDKNCNFRERLKKEQKNKIETLDCDFEIKEELEIVQLIKRKIHLSHKKEIQQGTDISLGTVRRILPKLQKKRNSC